MPLTREQIIDALARDQFYLVYQPIVNLETRKTVGLEALVRWAHPERGEIGPATFIQDFERIGAIADLGVWVSRRAMGEASEWHRAERAAGRELYLSVNVSGYELQQPEYAEALVDLCDDFEHRCRELRVEVIESDFDLRGDEVHANLRALRSEEVMVLIDDFGKGASTTERLAEINADGLKLDASLIAELEIENRRRQYLSEVIPAADAAGLVVIAEGIETEAQRQIVLDCGGTFGQGFLFSRPVRAADVPRLLPA